MKELPPEGLWVSGEKERIPIVEHLIALQHYPERFGLTEREVKGADIATLRKIAERMIREEGWVRFRYLSETWNFEVDSAKKRIEVIESILADFDALLQETVSISQAKPRKEFRGTVEDVYDRKVYGYQENPEKNRWRFS